MGEGCLNYIAFKAIESTESFSPQLSICFRKGSISVEYYAKIAVFFGVLDGLTSQCECFIEGLNMTILVFLMGIFSANIMFIFSTAHIMMYSSIYLTTRLRNDTYRV